MFYEVLVACGRAFMPTPPRACVRYSASGGAFDVSQMRYRYNHVFVGVEVFGIELDAVSNDLGTTLVAVLLLHLYHLLLDYLQLQLLVGEYLLEMFDEFHLLVVLFLQLFAFQAYQRAQTHVDDGRGLTVAGPETLHKARFGRIRGLRRTDYVNHLVDVVLGYEQAFQYVRPLLPARAGRSADGAPPPRGDVLRSGVSDP